MESVNARLASSSKGELILWGLGSGEIMQRYEASAIAITAIAIDSAGMMMVSAQQDDCLHLWNLLNAAPMNSFTGLGSTINSVAISPIGDRILYTNLATPVVSTDD